MKMYFWRSVFALTVLGILALLGITVWHSNTHAETFVDVLKILLTGPVLFSLLAVWIVLRFQQQIRLLFKKGVKTVKVGNTEITFDQQRNSAKSDKAKKEIRLSKDEHAAIMSELETLRKKSVKSDEDMKSVINTTSDLIIDQLQKSKFWKFQYLNMFFVANTKVVLKWLQGLQSVGVTKPQTIAFWSGNIQDQSQPEIIVNVLIQNDMVKEDQEKLLITDEGQEFLKFLESLVASKGAPAIGGTPESTPKATV